MYFVKASTVGKMRRIASLITMFSLIYSTLVILFIKYSHQNKPQHIAVWFQRTNNTSNISNTNL